MRILILGLNYAPEQVGIGPYTTGLARALAAAGHKVSVVAGQPYYPAWQVAEGYSGGWASSIEDGVAILRCPLYVPAEPSGAKRILHHFSFALSALLPMLRRARREKPDLVIGIAPSLISAPVAKIAARLAGARSWLHIQDFEVEAAFATGLIAADGRAGRIARAFEARVLRGFGRVSTISPQMCAKLREKGVGADRIVEFRNWADIDSIVPLAGPSSYRAAWGITARHVALYSGNIANKQGIEIIVDAARRLADRRDILFVVCGDGPNRKNLVAAATGLDNIRFEALQPKERLSDLLGLASIHLLPQLAGAADLVLPSKMANMMASGRPIVATAMAGTGLAGEVEGCGIVVAPSDATAFAQAIALLADDDARRASLGRAARARAEERWSRDAILGGLERKLG